MSWTQSTDPTNTNPWVGNCNNLDIFTPTEPVEPPDFDVAADYSTGVFILDGFEFPIGMYDATSPALWTNGWFSGSVSLSTDVRSSTKTGGHALQWLNNSTTRGGRLKWYRKPTTPRRQFFRLYFKIPTWTNAHGSRIAHTLFGWTDSTGDRSSFNIVAPATIGSGPKGGVSHDSPGLGTQADGTTTLTLDTWYRVELVTDNALDGMWTTANLYLGDETTVIETIQCHSGGSAAGGFPYIGGGLISAAENSYTVIVDDLRVQTTTGSQTATVTNEPKYGPGGIWVYYPKRDSSVAFTPLSGTNFSNVDDLPSAVYDSDTTYVIGSGTTLLRDLYDINFYPSANYPTSRKFIKAVMVHNIQKNVSGSNHNIRATYVDPLDTIWVGSDSSPGSSYAAGGYLFLIYPDPLPVEFSNIQQIGLTWDAGTPTGNHRVTAAYGMVDIFDGDE